MDSNEAVELIGDGERLVGRRCTGEIRGGGGKVAVTGRGRALIAQNDLVSSSDVRLKRETHNA